MRIKLLAILVLAFALPMPGTATISVPGGNPPRPTGYDVNKDLVNRGPVAHDLAVVLEGGGGATSSFNGYHSGSKVGWFSTPSSTLSGGNTTIHWQSFTDGGNDLIDFNQTIHVGYSTSGGAARKVVDMYWTNLSGNRIPDSVVVDADANLTYGSRWSWQLSTSFTQLASVSHIRLAVLPAPIPLPSLGGDNYELGAAFQAVDGALTLAPGASTTIDLPADIAPGSAVVISYEVSSPGSGAILTNYVQAVIPIPTAAGSPGAASTSIVP